MKKSAVIFLLFFAMSLNAQKTDKRSHNQDPKERKEELWKYREQLLIDELGIAPDKQDAFKQIHKQYHEENRRIKKTFNPVFDVHKLSDAEAQAKIEQGFIVGEQLIANRRKFAKEMQAILSPQQILKLFQVEGIIKKKVRTRHCQIDDKKNKGIKQ